MLDTHASRAPRLPDTFTPAALPVPPTGLTIRASADDAAPQDERNPRDPARCTCKWAEYHRVQLERATAETARARHLFELAQGDVSRLRLEKKAGSTRRRIRIPRLSESTLTAYVDAVSRSVRQGHISTQVGNGMLYAAQLIVSAARARLTPATPPPPPSPVTPA